MTFAKPSDRTTSYLSSLQQLTSECHIILNVMSTLFCLPATPATWWRRMEILEKPAEEDVKKVERRLASEKKKAIANTKKKK